MLVVRLLLEPMDRVLELLEQRLLEQLSVLVHRRRAPLLVRPKDHLVELELELKRQRELLELVLQLMLPRDR